MMKTERNQILNKMKKKVEIVAEDRFKEELEQIERINNNQKSHNAVKLLNRMKPDKKLNVYDKDGKHCMSVKQQVEIITEVFKDIFVKPNQDEVRYYPPCKNIPPFDAGEISKATRKLKNGKSPGIDDLPAEISNMYHK